MTTESNLSVSSDQSTTGPSAGVKKAAEKFFATRPTLWGSSIAPLIRAIAFEAATHPEESDESRASLDAELDRIEDATAAGGYVHSYECDTDYHFHLTEWYYYCAVNRMVAMYVVHNHCNH